MKHIQTFESFINEGKKYELKVLKSSLNDALALLRKEDFDFHQMPGKPAEDFVVVNFATTDELEAAEELLGAQKNRESFLSEAHLNEEELFEPYDKSFKHNNLDKFTDIGKDYLHLDSFTDRGEVLWNKFDALYDQFSDEEAPESVRQKYKFQKYPKYREDYAKKNSGVSAHLFSFVYDSATIYGVFGYPSTLTYYISKKDANKIT